MSISIVVIGEKDESENYRTIRNCKRQGKSKWRTQMIEIFVDAPIELQVLILFGIVMIVKELWTWE